MYKKLFPLLLLLFCGCADIHQTIYLQDVEINGPLNHPPIFITDNKKVVKVSPWLSFNSMNQVSGLTNHSMVNSNGVFQVDSVNDGGQTYYRESSSNNYVYNQNNVKWNLPNVKGGVDVDIPISKVVSIFGSFNYSSQNAYEMTGGSFGFGFCSVKKNDAIRFNLGCSLQQYQYDAATVIVKTIDPLFGKEYTQVEFFHDVNKKSNLNFFGNLTYNSLSPDLPFNFFFSLAFFSQTLLSFQPETETTVDYSFFITTTTTDARGEISATFISFSPGIYINLTPTMRCVLGVNIAKDLSDFTNESGSFSSGLVFMPLAKIDFLF